LFYNDAYRLFTIVCTFVAIVIFLTNVVTHVKADVGFRTSGYIGVGVAAWWSYLGVITENK
jgi:hypothetical protein